ncbi:MAG: VCBS repeat-containing protein [Polyangiaceae bacterium]
MGSACALLLASAQQGCGVLIGTSCSDGHYDSYGSPEQCVDTNHYMTCEGGEGQDHDAEKACPSDTPVCVATKNGSDHGCESQDQIDCVAQVPEFYVDDLHAANLNGDALSDLVFVSESTLGVALGTASGFSASIKIADFTSEFSLAHMNDDAAVDLVAMDRTGSVNILLGQGDGTFATPKRVLNGALHLLATGDLDADGIDDIVVQSDPGRFAWLGSAQGFALSEIVLDPRTVPTRAIVVQTDSGAEILFADAYSDVDLYAREGGWALKQSLSGQFVTAADFNGDGRPDLLINTQGYADVYLGQANGSWELGASVPGGARLAADLDADGNVDIELQRASGLLPLRGRGDGTFVEGPELHLFTLDSSAFVLVATARGNELLINYGPTDQVNASCVAR